ncbi:DUF2911 domain-containing protein [Allomuricauda taeanensis]|uniref:DUF2911 domain-containing protein n=1 Tax=Flagellimonas taeanensis TaxID=1005926 RepID=UPI002E7B3B48|nr:DUF2911 domain-containing protein [Allomuricauda taeanensis]MEE1962770.1 DUF2911 domain-containing protein [Allomuricauda taeanensis]
MKRLLSIVFVLSIVSNAGAQLTLPAKSPQAELQQTVGLTEIVIKYSRPSMQGRTVFGDLVPYGALWRTGANENTTITFGDDVKVGDKELKAGTYAIYTRPGETFWEVILYSDTGNWGLPEQWDPTKVAAMVKVEAQSLTVPIETFTISLDDLHKDGASLALMWENVYVGVQVTVPTVAKATASIEELMDGEGISANDYFAAAQYYFQEEMDMAQAKNWIDEAVAKNPDAYWMTRMQSLIYAKLGDTKGAIEAAKKSLVSAQKAGNLDEAMLVRRTLQEWGWEEIPDEIYCCSNHEKRHCGKLDQLEDMKKSGCTGIN